MGSEKGFLRRVKEDEVFSTHSRFQDAILSDGQSEVMMNEGQSGALAMDRSYFCSRILRKRRSDYLLGSMDSLRG